MTRGSTKGRSIAKPGAALRNLRLAKGWTLGEVSQRTGLPLSTLSKVENDKMSLTYDKLVRISEGMEIDLAELFNPGSAQPAGPSSGRRSITRASEGREIETPNYDHLYPAADLLNKRLVPIIAEVRARSLQEFGQLIRHPGEEYAYVLEGAIELHTDLYAPVRLETGDSIYFDSSMGHAYIAAAPGPCRVLSVCSANEALLYSASSDAHKTPPPGAAVSLSAPAAKGSGTLGKKSKSSRLR